jgi:hypothetical protein
MLLIYIHAKYDRGLTLKEGLAIVLPPFQQLRCDYVNSPYNKRTTHSFSTVNKAMDFS